MRRISFLRHSWHRDHRVRGLTLTETATGLALGGVGISVLAVTTGAGITHRHGFQSTSNLMALNEAHHAYAMDHEGRQWSPAPDDMDECGGIISCYTNTIGCIDSLVLGADANGSVWGWWIGGNLCEGQAPGDSGYWQAVFNTYVSPYALSGGDLPGSSIVYNARGFRDYVSDNTYDPIFFQPGSIDARMAAAVFDEDVEFAGPYHPRMGTQPILLQPGYSLSASAMWGLDVHRAASAGGWQDPRDTPGGYAAPTVDQCLSPDLKTRMVERWWIDGAPSRFHPELGRQDIEGSNQIRTGTPGQHWLFNQGHEARPLSLFFDGSVAAVRTGDAYLDDLVHQATTGGDGLWSRDTPMGEDGMLGEYGVDAFTSFHVLTTDGIRGRDLLSRRDG
jgi:hypothetical protein